MRCLSSLITPLMALATCVTAAAQAPNYKNVGRTPSAEEIRASNIHIGPEGKELPPGSGTAKEGAKIFAQQCAYCHGPTGTDNGPPQLWPYSFTRSARPVAGEKANLMPVATDLWDAIRRSMPPPLVKQGKSLNPDEVYAVTAWILYRNGIIQESDVMDATTLPKVQMPKRKYTPPY